MPVTPCRLHPLGGPMRAAREHGSHMGPCDLSSACKISSCLLFMYVVPGLRVHLHVLCWDLYSMLQP